MFTPDTPMVLKQVTFKTVTVDDETRRVVICTFGLAPFTAAHAADLNVKSLVFDGQGLPKSALEVVELHVTLPTQRLTFAMAPDQQERRVILRDVQVQPTVRVKIKQDREPAEVGATLKVNFSYPTADDLLYIATGVEDVHYLTFEPEQGQLGLEDPAPTPAPRHRTTDLLRPGVYGEH